MRKTIATLLALVMVICAFSTMSVSAEESSIEESSIEESSAVESSEESSEDVSAESSEESAESSESEESVESSESAESEESVESSESEESVESSESEESAESSESSEEVGPVEPADITYTVTLNENEDGTATIVVTLPEGVVNGKIVLSTSENLTYVADSYTSSLGGLVIPNATEESIIVSFSNAVAYATGAVLFEATYTIAADAEITEADIIVSEWNIGDGNVMIGTIADGDVEKVINLIPEESSESSESEESVESSEPEEESNNNPPATGDLGIAAFAVLAVISAGAVVVLKKRA